MTVSPAPLQHFNPYKLRSKISIHKSKAPKHYHTSRDDGDSILHVSEVMYHLPPRPSCQPGLEFRKRYSGLLLLRGGVRHESFLERVVVYVGHLPHPG